MEVEVTILSETSQTQKDKYHMFSLICGVLCVCMYACVLLETEPLACAC
jgi:hypothetical protein